MTEEALLVELVLELLASSDWSRQAHGSERWVRSVSTPPAKRQDKAPLANPISEDDEQVLASSIQNSERLKFTAHERDLENLGSASRSATYRYR